MGVFDKLLGRKKEKVREGAYVSEEYGFSIVPPEEWVTDENEQGEAAHFSGPIEDNFTVNITITIGILPYEMSLEEVTAAGKEQLSAIATDYNLISERDRIINGVEAHELVATHIMDMFDLKCKQIYLIKHGSIVYVVTFNALKRNYDTYKEIFEESVQTFEVI